MQGGGVWFRTFAGQFLSKVPHFLTTLRSLGKRRLVSKLIGTQSECLQLHVTATLD
jgi:hypothetical protein